jgi:hypothetical protein
VALLIGGEGLAGGRDLTPVPLRPSGVIVRLPLVPLTTLTGRRGARETLQRTTLVLDAPAGAVLRAVPAGASDRTE